LIIRVEQSLFYPEDGNTMFPETLAYVELLRLRKAVISTVTSLTTPELNSG
jgi:hypothetical protein